MLLEFLMRRRSLYLFYAALWVLAGGLFCFGRPHGGGPLTIFVHYGLPAFALYFFSTFLLEVRGDVVSEAMAKEFLQRRRMPIALFLFE